LVYLYLCLEQAKAGLIRIHLAKGFQMGESNSLPIAYLYLPALSPLGRQAPLAARFWAFSGIQRAPLFEAKWGRCPFFW
jgi:hypothetical protein